MHGGQYNELYVWNFLPCTDEINMQIFYFNSLTVGIFRI